MKDSFPLAFQLLMQFEGGYSFDKDDPGGETNFGISKRAYPKLDIKNMTEDQAKEIYEKDYWNTLSCNDLSSPLDTIAFDTSVNCGVSVAKKFLAETQDWKDYLFKRMVRYIALTREKPELRKYVVGWLSRCLTLWMKLK